MISTLFSQPAQAVTPQGVTLQLSHPFTLLQQ
jgi:hypothetical protein